MNQTLRTMKGSVYIFNQMMNTVFLAFFNVFHEHLKSVAKQNAINNGLPEDEGFITRDDIKAAYIKYKHMLPRIPLANRNSSIDSEEEEFLIFADEMMERISFAEKRKKTPDAADALDALDEAGEVVTTEYAIVPSTKKIRINAQNSSHTFTPRSLVMLPPGTKGVVLGIQHLDASIMMQTLAKVYGLNIHDAIGVSILDTNLAGDAINRAYYELSKSFSLLKEVLNLFKNVNANYLAAKKEIMKERSEFAKKTAIASSNKKRNQPEDFTNHSGGAAGYDAEWDLIGNEFGMTNNKHYLLPEDGAVADKRLLAKGVKPVDATNDVGPIAKSGRVTGEGQLAVTNAERIMGRIALNHFTRNTKKIRNYAQVKNADGIFAIGSLIPKGADITINRGVETKKALVPQVNGGTSVAVQLGIMMNKPTFVFNQVVNDTYPQGWYKWDSVEEDFIAVDTPILTNNFAGIGTSSNTTEEGKQAIRDVYKKTFESDTVTVNTSFTPFTKDEEFTASYEYTMQLMATGGYETSTEFVVKVSDDSGNPISFDSLLETYDDNRNQLFSEESHNRIESVHQYDSSSEEGGFYPFENKEEDDGDTEISPEYGSSEDPLHDPAFNNVKGVVVDSNTIIPLFNSLKVDDSYTDSAEHEAHLLGVIDTFKSKLLQPLELLVAEYGDKNLGKIKGKVIKLQKAVKSSRKMTSGLRMSMQEAFAHEIVHAITAIGINRDSVARDKLKRLFQLAEKYGKFDPTDFMNREQNPDGSYSYIDKFGNVIVPGTAEWSIEYKEATARYNYIFNNVLSTKEKSSYLDFEHEVERNNYLHEFMAMGLTNANFIKKLSAVEFSRQTLNTKSDTLLGRLSALFETLIDTFIKGKPSSVSAYAELHALALELSEIQQKRSSALMRLVENTETLAVTARSYYINKALNALAKNNAFFATVRDFSVVNDKLNVFHRILRKTLFKGDGVYSGISGAIQETALELTGPSKRFEEFDNHRRMFKNLLDQDRANKTAAIKKIANKFFKTPLVKAEKIAITKAGFNTDLTILMNNFNKTGNFTYSIGDIIKLLKDKQFLESEQKRLLGLLNSSITDKRYYHWINNSTQNLASFITRGSLVYQGDLGMNATIIAKGNRDINIAPQNWEDYVELIDAITTLKSLTYVSPINKSTLAGLLSSETEGTLFALGVFNALKQEALNRSFQNNPLSMRKGYTVDSPNKNISIVSVPAFKIAELEKLGYELVSNKPLKTDSHDIAKEPMYLMRSKYGAMSMLETAMVSYTHEQSMGTSILDKEHAANNTNAWASALANFKAIEHGKVAKNKAMMTSNPIILDEEDREAVAIRDTEGKVIDYRYIMKTADKDFLLERDNSFDTVLGKGFGAITNKVETKENNRKTVRLLRKDYEQNFNKDRKAYIEISPNSNNPDIVEAWRLMPYDMREEIKKVWGGDTILVHKEVYSNTFGQRKLGIQLMEKKDLSKYQGIPYLAAGVNNIMTALLKNKYGLVFNGAWQDVVSFVKDVIVIKSIFVLRNNIISNTVSLVLKGLSPKNAIAYQLEGLKAAKDYQLNSAIVREMGIIAAVRPLTLEENKDFLRASEELAVNNTRPLFEAGVYQSINEDIYLLDEDSVVKNKLETLFEPVQKYVDPYLNMVPDIAKSTINELAMTHSSHTYTFLRQLTQFSDFMARYALHKHHMENGMDFNTSINKIMEQFIEYDKVTNKWIQWANDNGLMLFTKYWLRNQRVIKQTMIDNPIRVAAVFGLQEVTGINIPWIMDSNIFSPGDINDPVELISSVGLHPLYQLWNEVQN
jgi:hypothetical protein